MPGQLDFIETLSLEPASANSIEPLETVAPFRPIHYLGSKLRLAGKIADVIDSLSSEGRVLDLFSGSGTVSAWLARNHPITAVDVQEYSRIICQAVLVGSEVPLNSANIVSSVKNAKTYKSLCYAYAPLIEYEIHVWKKAKTGELSPLCEYLERVPVIRFLKEYKNLKRCPLNAAFLETEMRLQEVRRDVPSYFDTVTYYYGGLYFSFEQAVALDSLANFAYGQSDKKARDFILAAVISTASSLVNTVGKQFAQPIRPRDRNGVPKSGLLSLFERDRALNAWPEFQKHLASYLTLRSQSSNNRALKSNFADVLANQQEGASVVYADPPYTRDHYSRFYHVLETIACQDRPDIVSTKRNGKVALSRGVYREDRHQSDFCIRSKALSAFASLFSKVSDRGVPLVLSYSPHESGDKTHPRVVTLSDLTECSRKYFHKVETRYISEISHSYLNHKDKKLHKRPHSEILLICQP